MEEKIIGNRIIPNWWEIVKVLKQPLLLLGTDGTILRINECALNKLKYKEKDIKYLSILDIIHKDDKVKGVNSYIDITYGNNSISTSIIRLREFGGSFLRVEQILQTINVGRKRKMILLTFQVMIENNKNINWDNAEEVIRTINGLTNMLDLQEFGSSYNRNVVDRIKLKLKEIKTMVSRDKVA